MHPDENRRHYSPDLGPNCLQRLSADDTGRGRDWWQSQEGAI